MTIEAKFTRCEPDDPNRCQGVFKGGQCPFLAIPGAQFCKMHCGPAQVNAAASASKRVYNLSKWQARVDEHADHDQVKGLRQEIGILRVLMEEMVSVCHDSSTLLMYSGRIGDLATRIEKMVSACHRLEATSGMLLDKTAALHIGSVIVELVSRYVSDEDALNAIGEGIVTAIIQAQAKVTPAKLDKT
jgi:hypothetical protein